MLASACSYVLVSVLVKMLADEHSAAAQTFYRQLVALLALLPAVVRAGPRSLLVSRPGLMLFRALASAGGFVLTYYSFQALPLALANTLSFTRILFLFPLAILFLGERPTLRASLALAMGFAGVLLALQPGTARLGGGEIAALCGALLLATTNISVKSLSRDTTITTLLVWSSAIGIVLTAPFAVGSLTATSSLDLALLVLMGLAALSAQICFIRGINIGDATVVGSIDYVRLPIAALAGAMFFAEMPGAGVWAGGALIVAAAVLPAIGRVRRPS